MCPRPPHIRNPTNDAIPYRITVAIMFTWMRVSMSSRLLFFGGGLEAYNRRWDVSGDLIPHIIRAESMEARPPHTHKCNYVNRLWYGLASCGLATVTLDMRARIIGFILPCLAGDVIFPILRCYCRWIAWADSVYPERRLQCIWLRINKHSEERNIISQAHWRSESKCSIDGRPLSLVREPHSEATRYSNIQVDLLEKCNRFFLRLCSPYFCARKWWNSK